MKTISQPSQHNKKKVNYFRTSSAYVNFYIATNADWTNLIKDTTQDECRMKHSIKNTISMSLKLNLYTLTLKHEVELGGAQDRKLKEVETAWLMIHRVCVRGQWPLHSCSYSQCHIRGYRHGSVEKPHDKWKIANPDLVILIFKAHGRHGRRFDTNQLLFCPSCGHSMVGV